jgi:hypothetical protein
MFGLDARIISMSKSHMPPVPPAERSPKGPKNPKDHTVEAGKPRAPETSPGNLKEQGQQGNIEQNTTARGRTRH